MWSAGRSTKTKSKCTTAEVPFRERNDITKFRFTGEFDPRKRARVCAGGNLGFGVLYAKGGYSKSRIWLTSEDFTTPADNFEDSATLDGFHLGAG